MIWPRKKISISKKHSRNAKWQRLKINKLLNKTSLIKCDNCWSIKLNHRVCDNCWYYKWEQIITIKTSKKEDTILEA